MSATSIRSAALFAVMLLGLAGVAAADSSDGGGLFGAKSARPQTPVVLPPAPSDLLRVHVTNPGSMQFFVDGKSISVEPGHIVRYTLVAKTAEGPRNVSYEGIDCVQRQWKLYAVWRNGAGKWEPTQDIWHDIPAQSVQRIHSTLYDDNFCKDFGVDGTAGDIARRIGRGLRAVQHVGDGP